MKQNNPPVIIKLLNIQPFRYTCFVLPYKPDKKKQVDKSQHLKPYVGD